MNLALATSASAGHKLPVNIGFLGASHSHAAGKLSVLKNSPDYRIVGAWEPDPKMQQPLRDAGIQQLPRKELLEHPEIQVIAVETPVHDHARDGLEVLRAGKHLHLEKAPSDKMAPFQQLVSLAREKRLLLQVGYMWRYNPGIVKALEAAREGWLGSIYMIRGSICNQLAANRRADWAEFVGGMMFEQGGHLIDPVVRLMGRPSRITPILRRDGPHDDTLKDNTVAVMEWGRAMGVIHASTLQPNSSRYRTLEIFGTNGCAVANPIESPSELTIDLAAASGPYAKGVQKVQLHKYSRYVDDFVELASAVRGESKLSVTYDEDLMVQEALLRCCGMF